MEYNSYTRKQHAEHPVNIQLDNPFFFAQCMLYQATYNNIFIILNNELIVHKSVVCLHQEMNESPNCFDAVNQWMRGVQQLFLYFTLQFLFPLIKPSPRMKCSTSEN